MDATLRQLVQQRAELRCEYCRVPEPFDYLPFAIDHIIAIKHHGATIEQNLAFSCCHCNGFKGDNIASIDGPSDAVVRLFHPRRDSWLDHFDWRGGILVGKTPEARATIHVLNINDPDRVELRELLMAQGVRF